MDVAGNKIIVYGGSEEKLVFPNDLFVFDTVKCEWQQIPKTELWPPRRIGCVGGVINNKLYIYGGGDYNKATETYDHLYHDIWSFDLDTNTWSKEVTSGREPSSSVFSNCFVLGHHLVISDSATRLYDTITKTWSKLEIKDFNGIGTCVKTNKALYYVGSSNKSKVDLAPFAFLFNACVE